MAELMELSVDESRVNKTRDISGANTHTTSISGTSTEHLVLSYRDFYPRCIARVDVERKMPRFDTFWSLMTDVNEWLLCSCEWRVLKVETVITKLQDAGRRVDPETSSFHMASHGSNIFLYGIRLWLIPKPGGIHQRQLIHYVHVFPLESKPSNHERIARMPNNHVTSASQESDSATRTPNGDNDIPPTVSGISEGTSHRLNLDNVNTDIEDQSRSLLESEDGCDAIHPPSETSCLKRGLRKWQNTLAQTPVAGEVLTVETVYLRARSNDPEVACGEQDIESMAEETCWDEQGRYDKLSRPVLRIFHLVQSLCESEEKIVDYVDFIPRVMEPARCTMGKPKFEPMSEVLQRVSKWLQTNQETSVINLQSIHVKVYQHPSGEVEVFPDSHYCIEEADKTTYYLRCIRVYVRRSTCHAHSELSNIHHSSPIRSDIAIQQKVFVPTRRGRTRFDPLSDSIPQINYWIELAAIQPWMVESDFTHFCPDHQAATLPGNEKVLESVHRGQSMHYVSNIRLHFLRGITEIDECPLSTRVKDTTVDLEDITIV